MRELTSVEQAVLNMALDAEIVRMNVMSTSLISPGIRQITEERIAIAEDLRRLMRKGKLYIAKEPTEPCG